MYLSEIHFRKITAEDFSSMQFRPLTVNLLLVANKQNILTGKDDITKSNSEDMNVTIPPPAGQAGSPAICHKADCFFEERM